MVICRSGLLPLFPGYERGYYCKICGKEVQVSAPGRETIAKGGTPFCNACGLKVVAKAQLDEIEGKGN